MYDTLHRCATLLSADKGAIKSFAVVVVDTALLIKAAADGSEQSSPLRGHAPHSNPADATENSHATSGLEGQITVARLSAERARRHAAN